MKNPCDKKKERKEISTVANVIFCFEFNFFFVIGISVNFVLLLALMVSK